MDPSMNDISTATAVPNDELSLDKNINASTQFPQHSSFTPVNGMLSGIRSNAVYPLNEGRQLGEIHAFFFFIYAYIYIRVFLFRFSKQI